MIQLMTEDGRKAFVSPSKQAMTEDSFTGFSGGGLVTLGEILDKAYGAAGVEVPEPPVTLSDWSTDSAVGQIHWSRKSFGSLTVGNRIWKFDAVNEAHTARWARIDLEGCHPSVLNFDFIVSRAAGVRLIYAKGKDAEDVTHAVIPQFTVKVEWQGSRPHTRKTDCDNVDFFFLTAEGEFVQLQVALTTRDGLFWVSIQEIFIGQVVRTTVAKADELNVSSVRVGGFAGLVAPLSLVNAYPGSDYLATFKDVGEYLVRCAIQNDAVMPLTRCKVARWAPLGNFPEAMAAEGWQKATVLFFNLVIGWGFALTDDGTRVYCHFKSIFDEKGNMVASNGKFPTLEPMKVIALKRTYGEKPKATAIRIL